MLVLSEDGTAVPYSGDYCIGLGGSVMNGDELVSLLWWCFKC